MRATADFEVKQLLKVYRKGLISDELFEAQVTELTNGAQNGRRQYMYGGKAHASERADDLTARVSLEIDTHPVLAQVMLHKIGAVLVLND